MKTQPDWRQYVRELKAEAYAIYLACRDPRTPWYAKLLAACVAGYAFSPIDLIPDFIPVIGHLDDLVLVPLGIALVLKLIPPTVLTECRQKARESGNSSKPRGWIAGGIIIAIYLVALSLLALLILRHLL